MAHHGRGVAASYVFRTRQSFAASVAPPTGLAFLDVHDHQAVLSLVSAAPGLSIVIKQGATLTPPGSPSAPGWTSVLEDTASPGPRIVTIDLPLNDTDYTVAAFGWDGVSAYSSTCPTVNAHALAAPIALTATPSYALIQSTSDYPGLHMAAEISAELDWAEGAAETRLDTTVDPSKWTVYADRPSAEANIGGTPYPPAGLPGGSSGLVMRAYFGRIPSTRRLRPYQS